MRKKYLTIIFSCTIIFSSIIFTASGKDLHVEEFGIETGKSINDGFVFVGGQYLDAPYIVTRKGLAILINDKIVEPPTSWPPLEMPSGDFDPAIPNEINKQTSFRDETFNDYIREKITYVQKHYTPEEESRIMEQLYRGLPFVKEAKIDEKYPDILHITTFKGETYPIGLKPPRREIKYDRESTLRRVESLQKYFKEWLERGDCLIFSKGSRVHIGAGEVIEQLPKLLKISRSPKLTKEKFKAAQEANLSYINEESFPDMVTNFSASPQLEKRLNELTEKAQQKESYLK